MVVYHMKYTITYDTMQREFNMDWKADGVAGYL